MDKEQQIKQGLTRFVTNIIDNKLSYYTTATVDKHITYFIDHDGNGNPDWVDAINYEKNNLWSNY